VDLYYTAFADGPTEIRRAVREQMGRGANQIKIFTGGGISSEKDPLHAVQYTAGEVQAAVEAANQYGTYVAAHAYTAAHIQLALDNGVKVIEHGALLTPEMAKFMAKNDIWLCPSFKGFIGTDIESFAKMASPAQVAKARIVKSGAEAAYKAAVAAGVKMAFGSDLLGPWPQAGTFENQVLEEFHWARKYMSDFEVLQMATGRAGELHALCGENTPYKDGPTGVIKEGAYADILLVKGNPLENVEIMADPDANLHLIMKDGKIYKNTLD
jgi:imidazolonepropionase-like amidohydrolase